jgi:hypothetical protein
MSKELETMTYMMAAEKMGNLIFTMENTLEFLIEYQVKPDEEVKKALIPLVEKFKKWTSNE